MRGRSLALFLCVAFATGCGSSPDGASEPVGSGHATRSEDVSLRPASCPVTEPAPRPLPGVVEEQRTLGYWLERMASQGPLDEPILSAEEITNHNAALRVGDDPVGQTDLTLPVDPSALGEQIRERLGFVHGALSSGRYVDERGERLEGERLDSLAPPGALPPLESELRVVTSDTPLRCAPTPESYYTPSLDRAFDRNRCSTLRTGEPVELLARWPNGMRLARSAYALGWLHADAPLSPPVAIEEAPALVYGDAPRPLTRRALLEAAFGFLDSPYGWGGYEGGRDCSRFLLDLFGSFGLRLPRNSGRQALAGSFGIDVSGVTNIESKRLLIESAATKGIVLLHFPGHIMLYLGQTEAGVPMVMHSFSEYLTPCEGTVGVDERPFDTLHRVDRVTVSDLSLGRGSSRTSFIERIEGIVILGRRAGIELRGAATTRLPAPASIPDERDCHDSLDSAIFRSPHRPNPRAPLRIIATLAEDPGPVGFTLISPSGARSEPAVNTLGGPPFSYWVEVERPEPGRWTAVLGDGSRVEACERFTVGRFPPRPLAREPLAPAWPAAWRWERDTEHLYAAFVEQLFREPVGEDATWPDLSTLLRDPARNLLHDHRGLDEDEALFLQPDCADLPYYLRAYFAWKLRLPFAFRRCSRGRAGRPPSCIVAPTTNLEPVDTEEEPIVDEIEAFRRFARRVARGVHSASARTAPRDDSTDVYPVAMTRESLPPGTVFADPYGHLLVVAAWLPQGLDGYGVMVGADAQPDGTIGRRRFWRGSFLFEPDTSDVGAGFKAWRPVIYDRREQTVSILDNAALRRTREHLRFSLQQYEGTVDDFYDSMEGLINPRPLDPVDLQVALVDALEESVARRIVSVDNGERRVAELNGAQIEMPEGYAIFETEGDWENFSTPSRDMRLLISIDAVTGFPDTVERNPARFGLTDATAEATLAALRARLAEELGNRSFTYRRSDGSEARLTLRELTSRSVAIEMAYNPNDCIERRWGAAEASDEYAPCRRHAIEAQRARMREYRPWFENRRRPPR